MATFKLEGEGDALEESTSQPKNSPPAPTADEFSFFLQDEGSTSQQPAPPEKTARPQAPAPVSQAAPTSPVAPSVGGPPVPAGPPTRVVAPLPDTPVTPRTPANSVTPPVAAAPAQPAQPAGPNLMRPAQSRADKSQPPGINIPAAIADSPTLTQPDAASIAQSPSPSDDLSSGFQNFCDGFTSVLDKGEDIFTWAARFAHCRLVLGLHFGGGFRRWRVCPDQQPQRNPSPTRAFHAVGFTGVHVFDDRFSGGSAAVVLQ